jgi:peroxiredoxin
VAALAPAAAFAQSPGAVAPAFTLTDTAGRNVQLADYRGKYIVLEWTNPECPFVRKHYTSGNMQGLQKEWGAREVVWLSINSTNTNNSEFKTPAEMAKWMGSQGAAQNATLIDSTSATGRAYAARATPHMFVIDPAGNVLYNGAIDDRRTANPADAKTAHNYVRAALTGRCPGNPSQWRRHRPTAAASSTRTVSARSSDRVWRLTRPLGPANPIGGRRLRTGCGSPAVVSRAALFLFEPTHQVGERLR